MPVHIIIIVLNGSTLATMLTLLAVDPYVSETQIVFKHCSCLFWSGMSLGNPKTQVD